MMGWYDERFDSAPGRMVSACEVCLRPMWFPKSKLGKYLTCGPECSEKRKVALEESRVRSCEKCGKKFLARGYQLKIGGGKYCSKGCTKHLLDLSKTPEAKAKIAMAMSARKGLPGKPKKKGVDSPNWKGGKDARDPIQTNQRLREYRAKNPEKTREWAQNRRNRKAGRLPRGTIKRIGDLQRWHCPVCAIDISSSYHVDHVVALSNGGKHEPTNIQLLCGPCNLKKWAKDPILFMQEMGFLL